MVEVLSVPYVSEPLVIGDLPRLSRFSGFGANSAYAADNPQLRHILIELLGEAWPPGLSIVGDVEDLQLLGARRVTELPAMLKPEALRTLRLDGPEFFDVASLSHARFLRWLDIASCPLILNVDAMVGLGDLERVDLAGVKSMEGWESLGTLRAEHFALVPNQIVPDDVARAWVARSSNRWAIPPRRPRTRARR